MRKVEGFSKESGKSLGLGNEEVGNKNRAMKEIEATTYLGQRWYKRRHKGYFEEDKILRLEKQAMDSEEN